ncbi:hypothetical protein EI168_07420 [Halomonas sp. FME1]|uniref:Uncharacterized protein n=1 Tax=Halomonas casei TaxID=2742613 RepID=A0ABR9F0E4_9GAMM|nr:hypothetical protein [Halomonas casei]MBE0399940.1 hypothetical protein [Halomonas casei]
MSSEENTKANQTWLKVQTNSFKTDQKGNAFKTLLLESLALILGDLSPTSASAHMNYLIKLLKSVSLWLSCCDSGPTVELFGLSEEGVFYALPSVCQSAISEADSVNIFR